MVAEGVDCILTNDADGVCEGVMILDCVGETEGVKVGSADVDKVYRLESDGTLLCDCIVVSVSDNVTVILPHGDDDDDSVITVVKDFTAVLLTVGDSVLCTEVDGDNVDEEVFKEVREPKADIDALDVDFADTEEDADATFVVETVLVGVAVVVKVDEAVTVEVTELETDAVPESNDDAVALTDDVNVPVELVDKVAGAVADTDDESTLERETAVDGEKAPVSVANKVTRDDAVILTDNVNVAVELVDTVASTVAETDEESTLEKETVVVGETRYVLVAIKVTKDDAVADVVDVEVALDVEDVVAEEVAVPVV
jgi:hypothetical protein